MPGRRRMGATARRSSPRRGRSCARQLERLAERGLSAYAGTELEFLVFRDTYEEAWHKGYRDLEPANLYNVDYSLLGTARVEPLIRRIRNEMAGAGLDVENSKGECNLGQHEINFRYADGAARPPTSTSIYKTGAKEIAAQEGMAITFMAKFDEREGSSCHIHLSLRARRRQRAVRRRRARAFDAFLAGQLACLRELTLLLRAERQLLQALRRAAPSPRPRSPGAATTARCSLRVVGHGDALRLELRLPGADVNPYLALSALIAAGLHGIDAELELEPRGRGQRLRGRQAARADDAARGARPVRRQRASPARRSATRSSTTTSTPPTSSSPRSRPRSPTGSASAGSNGCDCAERRRSSPRVRSQTAFEETLERLGTAIKLGLLTPGTRLPAERELCEQLGIARSTLRQALTALVQSGHLHAVRGRGGGTFVADSPPVREPPTPEVLADWRDALRRADGGRARHRRAGGRARRAGGARRARGARRGDGRAAGRLPRLPAGRRALPRRAGRGDRPARGWWRR